jgi:hypothetical protein
MGHSWTIQIGLGVTLGLLIADALGSEGHERLDSHAQAQQRHT